MSESMTGENILQHLDAWFHIDNCPGAPMPDNAHEDYAEMRLTIFHAPQMWAMVFEDIGWWANAERFLRNVYVYGNCVEKEGWIIEESSESICNFADDKPPYEWRNDKYFDLLDRADFSVVINGERHDFTPTAQDYKDARIQFKHQRIGAGSLSVTQMLRFLCHKMNHPFFMSREELHRVLDMCAPSQQTPLSQQPLSQQPLSQQMQVLLQTRDWQHPQIGVDEETPISSLESWQVLARAIESGDLAEWNNFDTSLFNTHWTFWDARKREHSSMNDDDHFSSDPDEETAWHKRDSLQQREKSLENVPDKIRQELEELLSSPEFSMEGTFDSPGALPLGICSFSVATIAIPDEQDKTKSWVFQIPGTQSPIDATLVDTESLNDFYSDNDNEPEA